MKLVQRLALSYVRTKFKLLSTISKKKAAEKAFELFCTPQQRNTKPLPAVFEQAEKLHFKMEGVAINGWRWKPALPGHSGVHDATRKVLICHGFESSVVNFDRYIKSLIKKGYEVLAFDAPGHGRSGGDKINAPLYKRTIDQVNKRYGPIQSFLAHSFGSLAVCLALEEISHSADHRLVLIAPATETITAIDSFFSLLQLDKEVRAEFEKVIIKKGGVSSSWYSIKRAMKHIHAKTLWFHDEEDDTTPLSDALKVKEENYPNIKFVITKGLGHSRIYRHSHVVKSAVEFL